MNLSISIYTCDLLFYNSTIGGDILTIGEKIQFIRLYRKFSRDDLANMTGIGKTSIYNYETNKRDMTIDVIEKIASSLKFPLSLIFNFQDLDDLIFEDNVRMHYAQLDREYSEESMVCEQASHYNYNNDPLTEEDYETMYRINFPRLLEWKISKLDTDYDFFNLMLNWYSTINKNISLNKEDIEELSIVFSRMLSLKCSENKLIDMLKDYHHDAGIYAVLTQISESKIRPDLSQNKHLMELHKMNALLDQQMDD